MQGTSPAQHGVMDAEWWLGSLLPSGSVYAFLAEHRRELFPDAMFADLFPSSVGRPSVPADVVAAVIAVHCTAHDYDDPGKPAIAWTDPDARARLVDALVGDAHRLLGQLPEQQLGPREAEAVALLALVAGQDVEPAADGDGTD